MSCSHLPSTVRATFLALALLLPVQARAQDGVDQWRSVLDEVLPAADRFADKQGEPPVFRGYRKDAASGKDVLVGYAFLTSDFPPEEPGYSGPIQVMVGMDTGGTVTGARVIRYHESLMQSRGDFLRRRGFQEQFRGKSYSDPFRVRRDVDGISGATITVGAMARGMRNAIRRVASARLKELESTGSGPLDLDALERSTWTDLVAEGQVQRITVLDAEMVAIDVNLFYLWEDKVGPLMLGPSVYRRGLEKLGNVPAADHLMLVGVDGPLAALFRASAMRLIQGEDTLKLATDDVALLGEPKDGLIDGEFRNAGLMRVDSTVDMDRPFTIVVDLRPGLGLFSAEYPGRGVKLAKAAPPPPPAETETPSASPGDEERAAAVEAEPGSAPDEVAVAEAPEVEPDSAAVSQVSVATPPPAPAQDEPVDLALTQADEETTVLARTLEQTSWGRVGWMLAVLVLAASAFFMKLGWLRWTSLGVTVAVLGFEGGFLSVSHILAGIKVGPSVYLNDLPLLLLVIFTVVTTLLWGRVFCGFLCPFGALQDFLEEVVPARFRRELPRAVHERAWLVKYLALAVVLAPALVGSDVSLFQYFEPFGTVFFFSTSVLLWTIAGGLLVASAIVPRFYCRYVCPLGASLALASVISPFRIRRVEQCGVCTVCERACPTGAITGERIEFKECVRCNICEVKLIEKAGVCRHDMEAIRPRLVTLRAGNGRKVADVA